tara:strand:+ start:2192 stop:2428 length:237 start_codon:yes stop_codon:yes gene_type:complete
MKVNLTPFSNGHSLEISQNDYEKLIQINEKGWSHCNSKEEYLAKLHYLRSGLNQGKIDFESFNELEKKIVINYWNKGT